jgi:hypothetical protein
MITDGISLPYSTLDYNSIAYNGTDFSAKLLLRESPSRILAVTYRNNIPVHQWLNNVKPGEAIAVDFNSFLPSKTITINKQIFAGSVKTMSGSNFATSYIFSDLYARQISKSSDLTLLPKLGYLDGFEKYLTSVILNEHRATSNVEYSKAGAVPESINLPDFTYSISSDELYGISAQFSNEYEHKYAYFTQSDQTKTWINWTLNTGNNEEFKTPTIPAEIQQAYPMLRVDGVKLDFIVYYHWPDGYTYMNYMKDKLAFSRRDVYEEFRYVTMP